MLSPPKEHSIVELKRTQSVSIRMDLAQDIYVHSWQLAFVQDCNMRCEYCISGYGRLGKKPGVMSREVQQQLLQLIFRKEFQGREIKLDFGNGETLFYFDEFLQFIEKAKHAADTHSISLSIHVATNGISLDEEKMQILAEHQVDLTFSIDGPAETHDRYRIDTDGKPTHARATDNWRRYQQITRARPDKIACNITSVIGDDKNLIDIHQFWLSEGLETYDCSIAQPSDFVGEQDYAKWQERRVRYLIELEALAMQQAEKLNIPSFLSDFRGPNIIKKLWVNILVGRNAGACGVAEDLVGVDMYGNIYPCDNFSGQEHWCIGTAEKGFHKPSLMRFRSQTNQLRSACKNCKTDQLCEGGCVATRIDTTLKVNQKGACAFNKEVAEIAQRSYRILLKNS